MVGCIDDGEQYWADAATRNCVWLFQVREMGGNNEDGVFEYWRTENVFLTKEEALAHGNSRPYEWGNFNGGWRIWGVMCIGLMAKLLGQHAKEFEDKVEHITNFEV